MSKKSKMKKQDVDPVLSPVVKIYYIESFIVVATVAYSNEVNELYVESYRAFLCDMNMTANLPWGTHNSIQKQLMELIAEENDSIIATMVVLADAKGPVKHCKVPVPQEEEEEAA